MQYNHNRYVYKTLASETHYAALASVPLKQENFLMQLMQFIYLLVCLPAVFIILIIKDYVNGQ